SSVSILARLMEGATFQQMFDKADLVIIAKPLSSTDTEEHTGLPGLDAIHVVGINTKLERVLVLKGDKAVKEFVLHHYRLDKNRAAMGHRPYFSQFKPKKHEAFLLFLIKKADGRYAPASGQVDPGAFSVIKLDGIVQ